ncbi:MAG: oligosaccharide flippase family protein [Candidatus Omnitrophica bacterium]|nr:oligosaccharide flippase family protein [Candidatus Omnitrophota bacterium]
MKKQIAKNVLSNYIATAVGAGLGLFLIPFLIRQLGKEAFGLIVLAESAIAFFELATVSIRMALSRYAAFSLAGDPDKEEFVEYLSTGRGILLVSSAVVLVSAFWVGLYFPALFRVPPGLESQARILFFLVAAAFSASIPNMVFWSVLYAGQRFDLINLCLSLGFILRASALFFFYSVLPPEAVSLTTYGLIYLAMTLTQNGLIYRWQRKIMPDLRIRLGRFKPAKVKEILSFGFHASVSRLSSFFSGNAVDILVNLFWGPALNAVYSVGFKMPSVMNRLFMEATWTLTPTFTELAAKKERRKLKRLFFTYTKLVALLILPPCFFLMLSAGPLILFWVGEGFGLSAQILPLLVFPLLTSLPFAVSGCVLNAYGKVKLPSRVSLAAAALNVGLAAALGKGFSQGLMGIAAASAIASFFSSTFFMPYYACRVAGFSFREYWKESFLKPFAWSALAAGGGFLAFGAADGGMRALPSLAASAAVPALLSYLGAYFFVLAPDERTKIKETFAEITGGLYAAGNKRHHPGLQRSRFCLKGHR